MYFPSVISHIIRRFASSSFTIIITSIFITYIIITSIIITSIIITSIFIAITAALYLFVYRSFNDVVGRDSSVGIAIRYGLDGPGIESRWGKDFLHFSIPALGSTQLPVQRVPGHSRGYYGQDVALPTHPIYRRR
jgi:hypothetical protein